MKVEGKTIPTAPLAGISTGQDAPRSRASSNTTADQESVRLSEKSSQLQALESSMKDIPEFDMGKIEAIRQALSSGNFSISSGRVAEKMLASSIELMAQKKA